MAKRHRAEQFDIIFGGFWAYIVEQEAKIILTQTTSNWSDGRSNRLPSAAHVKELKEMFLTGDIQRKDIEYGILLGTTTADFQLHFAEDIARTPNITADPMWRAAWVPGDKPETVYREADWGAHEPVQELETLAGKLASRV